MTRLMKILPTRIADRTGRTPTDKRGVLVADGRGPVCCSSEAACRSHVQERPSGGSAKRPPDAARRYRINALGWGGAAICWAVAAAAVAQPTAPPWDRATLALATTPTATPGRYDATVVWQYRKSPNSTPLNLGTRIELRRNGVTLGSRSHTVTVQPSAVFCFGPNCNGTCGSTTFDGGANDLHCLDADRDGDCWCGSLPITDELPGVDLGDGDELTVTLIPLAGALSEVLVANDLIRWRHDGEPRFWDRGLDAATLEPIAGTSNRYRLNYSATIGNRIGGWVDFDTIIEISSGVLQLAEFSSFDDYVWGSPRGAGCGGPCGPAIEPGFPATSECRQHLSEICLCYLEQDDTHELLLSPGAVLTLQIRPAPGGLPELRGMSANDRRTLTVPPSCTRQLQGDSNCTGRVDFDDIQAFVTALIGERAWRETAPGASCQYECVNDINADGTVDFDDIGPFVECLVRGGC